MLHLKVNKISYFYIIDPRFCSKIFPLLKMTHTYITDVNILAKPVFSKVFHQPSFHVSCLRKRDCYVMPTVAKYCFGTFTENTLPRQPNLYSQSALGVESILGWPFLFSVNCTEKTKIKKKEIEHGPICWKIIKILAFRWNRCPRYKTTYSTNHKPRLFLLSGSWLGCPMATTRCC